MNLETRIEALERRADERAATAAPLCWQRADRDAAGHVVACERMEFPRNPPNMDTLGPMLAGMLAMVRVPFSRATCHYTKCEHWDTCCADGSLTRQKPANSPAVAPSPKQPRPSPSRYQPR